MLLSHAKGGPAMIAQQLHRLCLDSGLTSEGGPLSTSSVDIAYIRCKTGHKLTYEQWLRVLCILSDESGWDLFRLCMEHKAKLGTAGLPQTVVGLRKERAHTHPPRPGDPQLRQREAR